MTRFFLIALLFCQIAHAQSTSPATPGNLTEINTAAPPRPTLTPPAKAIVVEEAPASPPALSQKQKDALPDEASIQLQIFLDQKHFGPGVIDGKPGLFTRRAIANYNTSLGRDSEDQRVLEEASRSISATYATAIVPPTVQDFIDTSLPYKRAQQAERPAMHYRSVAEFMAERYHTNEDLLISLNSQQAVRSAKAGSVLRVPNVEPFLIESLKHGRGHGYDETLSARHVIVDTTIKQVLIYELQLPPSTDQSGVIQAARPKLIASFPITPGKTQFIPKGFWNLKNSIELIEWRYDQQMLDHGVRSKTALAIPPGPNNPIGVVWNGLTKSGIGIHGTDNPRTIGRARSAGCIRLANWDAARFPTLVRPGAVVVIR